MKKLLLFFVILTILSCSNETLPEKITTYYDNGNIKFEEITSFRSLSSKKNQRTQIIKSYYSNGNIEFLSHEVKRQIPIPAPVGQYRNYHYHHWAAWVGH